MTMMKIMIMMMMALQLSHLAKASMSSTVSGREMPAVSGSHNPDQEFDTCVNNDQQNNDKDYDEQDEANADQVEQLVGLGGR